MNHKKTIKGYYVPYYKNKYVGDINNILYKSSWERTFMIKFCDLNPNVTRWSYEPLYINYISPIDNREHKYYVDFWVELNNEKNLLIEIKPNKSLKKPILKESTQSQKKIDNYIYDLKTYYVNIAKWDAAIKFCKEKNWEFKIFTEKQLDIKL